MCAGNFCWGAVCVVKNIERDETQFSGQQPLEGVLGRGGDHLEITHQARRSDIQDLALSKTGNFKSHARSA